MADGDALFALLRPLVSAATSNGLRSAHEVDARTEKLVGSVLSAVSGEGQPDERIGEVARELDGIGRRVLDVGFAGWTDGGRLVDLAAKLVSLSGGLTEQERRAQVAEEYGMSEGELHEAIMGRRAVVALCAAVDLAVLRGQLDARSVIADARLVVGDPDAQDDEQELLRRIAPSRPASQRSGVPSGLGETGG